jgi:hypothetical protein
MMKYTIHKRRLGAMYFLILAYPAHHLNGARRNITEYDVRRFRLEHDDKMVDRMTWGPYRTKIEAMVKFSRIYRVALLQYRVAVGGMILGFAICVITLICSMLKG